MQTGLQRAKTLISEFQNRRILVIGDLMLDRYIYGSVRRISPEAPVPVALVQEEKNMPGGAANVARNVSALGAGVLICGTAGCDHNGKQLLNVMLADGIDTKNVLSPSHSVTTVKMRIIAERQQVVRVDWDGKVRPEDGVMKKLCRLVAGAIAGCSGVILADYAKGIVCQQLVDSVLAAAQRRNIPVALDPKENRELRLDGITIVKPNRKEAFAMAGMNETEPCRDPLKDIALAKAGTLLMEKWGAKMLVITLGAQGMLVMPRGHSPFHVPTVAREVFDVSGAGDTTIAAMLLAISAGANACEAAELANCAAGVVVGKIGTATCSDRELLKFISEAG